MNLCKFFSKLHYPPIKNLKSREIFHLLLVEVLFNYRSSILNDVVISKIIFNLNFI